jgi:hypothetical protein
MRIHATCLDHVVLNVSDLDASRRWWSALTGARATRDHEGEVSFTVGGQAIRLRSGVPAPRGSISVCLLADASIDELYLRSERVSDVAVTTFEHVFEVDSRLMERWVLQQEFPNWDSLRIMNSRHEHLDWMHRHFATRVVVGSELLAEVDAADADAGAAAGENVEGTP